LYEFLMSSIHATCPAHLILLTIFGEAYKLQNSKAPHYAVFSSLPSLPPLRQNNPLSALLSDTLNPCYSLNA
jgi:hypothetical protein